MTGALTQAPPRQQLHHEVFAIVWGCLPWSASLLMGERADGLSQLMVICIILLLKSEKKGVSQSQMHHVSFVPGMRHGGQEMGQACRELSRTMGACQKHKSHRIC